MAIELRYTYNLLPKQRLFVRSTASETCFSGGFGAGKTRPLLIKAAHVRGQDRRMAGFILRAKLDDIVKYVLPPLFEADGDQPPVLPPGTYTWNKSERLIRLHTGATLRYAGLGDRRRNDLNRMGFRGANLTDLFIDQAEEITLKQYENALGRMRSAGAGLDRQVNITANPQAASHWIAKRFGITAGHDPRTTPTIETSTTNTDARTGKEVTLRRLAILTHTFENPHLPADYIAQLSNYSGVMYQRYVLGRWVGSEGAVYDNWDRAIHAVTRKGPWARTIVGLDDGMGHPAAIIQVRVDGDERAHVERSVIASDMLIENKCDIIEEFMRDGGEIVVCDPSNAQMKAELRARGIPVVNGKNNHNQGIQVVRSALQPDAGGEPGLTIDPANTRLIEQMESYTKDENAKVDRVLKVDDDGPDAVRYVMCHLHRPPATVFDGKNLRIVAAKAKAMRCLVGSLYHTMEPGQEQDQSIEEGKSHHIHFDTKANGPMKVWASLRGFRPIRDTVYVIFVSCGDGGGASKSVVTVGDVSRSSIAAEWVMEASPERVARIAAMLSIWFTDNEGEPALVGYHANGPGLSLAQNLQLLGVTCEPWQPDPRAFAEAVRILRTVWETGRLIDGEPAAVADAGQYVMANQTVMHAAVLEETERRGSWSDRIIARAGLWRMMAATDAPEPPELMPAPTSVEAARREGKKHKARPEWTHRGGLA